ncbi:DUF3634 family protein [Cerasicoccus arenae]|uniref:Uncharacterized protein n=1 Tax=Cerasicoccus arenae TaxID=424488 RepID=A0A8J3GCU2_9BACT|nr:DUF3634 family protein [Cerasicoccus arenae]MBK1859214.1 DUF3634 family protein [Cerasicoccus arenae]GHC01338.1 hypothetical protein GCM10007047_17240 [Cerasicoccus arenae]
MNLLLTVKRLLSGAVFAVGVSGGVMHTSTPCPLPSEFLAAVREKVERGELQSGVIYGVKQRGGLTLKFSMGFPAPARQPLLNVWHVYKSRYGI